MFGLLRFILAVNVVAFHIIPIAAIGSYAVYTFFILSGFLMTHIMQETYGYSFFGFKKYALNRFLRLFPIYWALLIISVLIIMFLGEEYVGKIYHTMILPATFGELAANISMIYPLLSEYSVRITPATWAITIEIFFYILIGLGISRNKKITIVWFVSSLLYTLYKMFFVEVAMGYGTMLNASLPFSLGALLYYYHNIIHQFISARIKSYTPLIVALFVANLTLVSSSALFPEVYWKVNFLGTWINLGLSILLITALLHDGKRYFTKVVDKFWGDLSYPIYVFHFSGASIASWILYKEPILNMPVFVLSLLITIVISMFVNKMVMFSLDKQRNKVKDQLIKT